MTPLIDTLETQPIDEFTTVELIASGYDWECPKCHHSNAVASWTDKVTCVLCGSIFETDPPIHPTG